MSRNPLNQRRRELGMSIPALAVRSGVPVSTLKRILNGGLSKASLERVEAVARALSMTLSFQVVGDSQTVREKQAEEKASYLMGLVQGTSALEAQAIDDDTLQRMVRQTTHELVAGSNRRLWS